MSLLIVIETFLIFTVIFFESFISPSTSIASSSSASVASAALHERCYFVMCCPLHKFLDVLVKEVQALLAVRGVLVIPVGEVILQVHF